MNVSLSSGEVSIWSNAALQLWLGGIGFGQKIWGSLGLNSIYMRRIPRIVSSQDWDYESAFRASRRFYRHEADRFVVLFRYRACLPRPHPGRVCPAACSRARVAGVNTEVSEIGQTSALSRSLQNMKRSSDKGVEKKLRLHIR